MKYLFAAALLLLAVPAQAAPLFSLVMVEDCVRLDKPHPIAGIGGLPMCVAETPFLTEKDIITARIVAVPAERLAGFGLADPHVLHLTVTPAAARRLTDLSYDNHGESFVAMTNGEAISLSSIGDPFQGADLELLVSLNDADFSGLVKKLGNAP